MWRARHRTRLEDQDIYMRIIMTVAIAATMFATVAAKANDNWAEERYKAKTGRYTPAEEARRASAARKANPKAQACAEHSCCRRAADSHNERTVGSIQTRELLRAKLGRDFMVQPLPQQDQQREIETGGKPNFSEEWWHAKWGRTRNTVQNEQAMVADAKASRLGSSKALSCCD